MPKICFILENREGTIYSIRFKTVLFFHKMFLLFEKAFNELHYLYIGNQREREVLGGPLVTCSKDVFTETLLFLLRYGCNFVGLPGKYAEKSYFFFLFFYALQSFWRRIAPLPILWYILLKTWTRTLLSIS